MLCHLTPFPVRAYLDTGLAPYPALRLEGDGIAGAGDWGQKDREPVSSFAA